MLLSFFCPGLFTSIAFDAGGVASGVMAATFLLPLSIGICTARGAGADEIMIDAFGTIALVAMMPTISIQIVGLMYKIKLSHSKLATVEEEVEVIDIIQSAQEPERVVANNDANDAYDDDEIEIIDFTSEDELASDNSLNS